MSKNIKIASHPAKLVESGPVHENGLRSTPGTTAFLAQARTRSFAPTKHLTTKTKQIVTKPEEKKNSGNSKIFASNTGSSH